MKPSTMRKWAAQGGLMGLAGLLVFHPFSVPSAPVQEGVDPFCSIPSRFVQMRAARANWVRQRSLELRHRYAPQDATPVNIGLRVEPGTGTPHLYLRGPVGQLLQVDSSSSLESDTWEPLLTVNLTSSQIDWLDSGADTARYYRLTPLPQNPQVNWADDFLMLDQNGTAHELFYPTELKAIVVAAVADSGGPLDLALQAFGRLAQSSGTNSIQYWLLLNDPTTQRTNIAAQVQASGANLPVLLDPQGFGARALGMTHAGEVVVVQPPTFAIAYRGDLPSVSGSLTNQPYLTAALSSVVQAQPLTFLRTPATGNALPAATGPAPVYSRDIAPIFYQRCAICHRPGDVAPFALTNYTVAVTWAPQMKNMLLTGQMPPWHADPEYGQWANTLALPATEKDALLRWIDAGTPRGDGSDPLASLPPPPAYRTWPAELGPPDALVNVGVQQVKAQGLEPYRYLFVQTPNPTSVWLRAAIILPSAPQVVHHYLVWTGQIGNQGLPNLSTYQESLAGYAPGVAPYIYPADSGFFLTASNWLTFNLHYTPNGVATNDFPVLALWYHKSPPPKAFHDWPVVNPLFLIPPNDSEYPVQASWTFPNAVRLERLNPHMHLRGKHVRFEAVYPDGSHELLLSVPAYDFRWQTGYEFAQPKVLPAQTTLLVTGAFDNSAQNLANPNPNATVHWGDQTADEMFVGFVDYVE